MYDFYWPIFIVLVFCSIFPCSLGIKINGVKEPKQEFCDEVLVVWWSKSWNIKDACTIINCCYGTRDGCVWVHFDFGSAKLLSQPANQPASHNNQNLCIQKHPQNTITTTTTKPQIKYQSIQVCRTYCWCNKQTHTEIPFSDLKQRVWQEKKKSLCKNQLLELPKQERERKKKIPSLFPFPFLFLFVCSKESHKRAN